MRLDEKGSWMIRGGLRPPLFHWRLHINQVAKKILKKTIPAFKMTKCDEKKTNCLNYSFLKSSIFYKGFHGIVDISVIL